MLTIRRFCAKVLGKKGELVYDDVNFRVIYNFLDWFLNQKTGVGERIKKGLTKKSSLLIFWCIFRLAFERATTLTIDSFVERRRMYNVRVLRNRTNVVVDFVARADSFAQAFVELGKEFSLISDKRENRFMTLADLKL